MGYIAVHVVYDSSSLLNMQKDTKIIPPTKDQMVAILDFRMANRAILIRNTNWISPEKFMLVL